MPWRDTKKLSFSINNAEFLRHAFVRRQGARMELTAHWSNKHKRIDRNL